jgi:hypothetical protein
MKKLIIVALSAVLAVMAIEPAHAEDQKVLAIIDTAIDSTRPEFKDKIIYEVCFTKSAPMGCNNETTFMDGFQSAASPVWPITKSGQTESSIYHGHNVVQSALKVNPNLKIVFIRVSSITKAGNQAAFEFDPVVSALSWVSNNARTYSIDAVAVTQASNVSEISYFTGKDKKARLDEYNNYCADPKSSSAVLSLKDQNIPVFAATGNAKTGEGGNATKVGFPACVSGVYGVGAYSAQYKSLEKATNGKDSAQLRLVSINLIKIDKYFTKNSDFGATSAATPIAAALYLKSNMNVDLLISRSEKVLGKYPYISK